MNFLRTKNDIYTELRIIHAKYLEHRLMDHIRTYGQRLNIPKLIRACEIYQIWPEDVQLYQAYDEWDQAILIMIEHFHPPGGKIFLLRIS